MASNQALDTRHWRRVAKEPATPALHLLSTHTDRQGVDISFTVCLFVCLFVCTVTDFSAEDKAGGVKFCRAVHRRPVGVLGMESPILGKLAPQKLPHKPKIGRIE